MHSAREEIAGDARADDVADAREFGADLGADLAEQLRGPPGTTRSKARRGTSSHSCSTEFANLYSAARPKPMNTVSRLHAALLAHDEHLGRGGALGILQVVVLLHDQRLPQRDHEQHAEQPAHHRRPR